MEKENPNTEKNLKKLNEANLPSIIEAQKTILEAELGRDLSFEEATNIIKSRLKEGETIGDFCKVVSVYDGDDAGKISNISEKEIERPNIKIDFNTPAKSIQTAKLNFGGKD